MDTVFYLVRHGEPFFEYEKRICLGRISNPPLSERGRAQAQMLARFLPDGLPVYCSPLLRSRETASYLTEAPEVMAALTECDMGPWDGLDFDAIRRDYPDLYARRENDHSLMPKGAESCGHAARRMMHALDGIKQDAIIVGHAGAIRALLCTVMGVSFAENRSIPLPYGSVTQLVRSESGEYEAEFVGTMPQLYPSEDEIRRMLRRQRTPEHVIAHCDAVAAFAIELAERVGQVDQRLLYTAAKLHDLCRLQTDHAAKGAHVLRMQGYPQVARIIALHHSPQAAEGRLDEVALLFYADKRIQGTELVSLRERFARSLSKCQSERAVYAHEQQRIAAERIEEMIRAANRLL